MLEQNKFTTLLNLISTSTNEELAWMTGYLNEIVSQQQSVQPATKTKAPKITIAYGTETGNSKKLATSFAASAKKKGIHTKVQSLEQYRPADLIREEYFLAVISTHGDGEPPAAAKKFYDHVHQNGFRLDNVKYSVLALGDTSYPLFCKAGEDVDLQLSKLGANRIAPIQKCDLDFDEEAADWFENIFRSLLEETPVTKAAPATRKKSTAKHIYHGRLQAHIDLNDTGSAKETYHIEISADDIVYQPGDSIGIVPTNNPDTIKEIIALTGIEASAPIQYKDGTFTIFDLLQKKLSIGYLPERVIMSYASIAKKEITEKRIDLVDLLKRFPLENPADFSAAVKILEPITPRLYSISSSPEAHPGEIHITVAKNYFSIHDERRSGLASGFLSGLHENDELEFYIHPNNQFRLPADDKDVIMIGPGTGIAPFRAFLSERDVTGATGKNWLFFGEQHLATDFLYQLEIQNWFDTGLLTKVNTAFSRDQPRKIYVQDKIRKHGAEFFEWINSGAYLYVCGTKDPMSTDVEKTILQVIETFGKFSEEEAVKYLEEMKDEGRYVKDVY